MKKLFFLLILLLIFPLKVNNMAYTINQKVIAITFDDGPSNNTKKIVSLFNKYNYNATFFLVGNKISDYKKDVLYIKNNNSEIGNHTYSHIWSTKYKNKYVLEEIKKTNDLIYEITGKKCRLFRPSYGAINKKLKLLIKEDIIMWTLDSKDWKYRNRNIIANKILSKVKDEDIILMHETYKESYEALKIILPKLKEMNYQVVTVSTLKEIKELRELNE